MIAFRNYREFSRQNRSDDFEFVGREAVAFVFAQPQQQLDKDLGTLQPNITAMVQNLMLVAMRNIPAARRFKWVA